MAKKRSKLIDVSAAKTEELESIDQKLASMAMQTDDEAFLSEDFTENVSLIMAERLSKGLKQEIVNITNPDRDMIKMLVQTYYEQQKARIALRNRIRAIEKGEKKGSMDMCNWLLKGHVVMEVGCKQALELILQNSEVGQWLLQITGIGPVIAAGCLAHFNIEGRQWASQFISYAGLNDNNVPFIGRVGAEKTMKQVLKMFPAEVSNNDFTDEMAIEFTRMIGRRFEYIRDHGYDSVHGRWDKNAMIAAAAKIPYNATLKMLMWKIGQSFFMNCHNSKSLYGSIYAERKIYETTKNMNLDYKDQAAQALAKKNYGKDTTAYAEYSQGRLPKQHIDMRARRYAVTKFVSHLFEEMYRVHNNEPAPIYYILAQRPDEHKDVLPPEIPYTRYFKGETPTAFRIPSADDKTEDEQQTE